MVADSAQTRYDLDISDAGGALPPELILALRDLLQLDGVVLTRAPEREKESGDYAACRLALNGCAVVFRVAKTTPAKIGQFVTLWKRPVAGGEIAPFDSSDDIDLVIVGVADAHHHGHFVFDRPALIKYGVMSHSGKGGKRAMRVYPPWSTPLAKEAIKSQQWQARYFVAPTPQHGGDTALLRLLLHA